MKAQYQNFIPQLVPTQTVAKPETLNNLLALNALSERDHVQYLHNVVAEYMPQTSGRSALDLGAGRGTSAMALAEMGLHVAAFDMHRNSICILQQIALQQELNISFGMGGILQLEMLKKKFDLIHDADCLTNTALAQDRARFLEGVQNVLEVGGVFVLKTAVLTENYDPADSFESLYLDEDHVLWRQTPACDLPGVVEKGGKHWTAQKKLASVLEIKKELLAAGFVILAEELEIPAGNNPGNLRLVLASAEGR